jgi:hypothetical protein
MTLLVAPYLRGILAVCILSTLFLTRPGQAVTPEEKAGARAAAQQGAEAYQAGRYQDAVDYFTRAESIVHAPPHLLYIARAELKQGHLVGAREAYMKIVHEELSSDAPRVFREAQEDARQELDELEPRLPLVSVVVEGADDGEVVVSRDGVELPSALVGIPIPTDPGTHSFQAKAPGLASQARRVTVAEGEKANIVLTLVATGEPIPAETTEEAASDEKAGTEGAPAKPSKSGTALKIMGFSTLGLGVAGLATGTAFVIVGANTRSQSDQIYNNCNTDVMGRRDCSTAEREEINRLDSDAQLQSIVGYVSLGVGGALLATGVTLVIVGSNASKNSATRPRVWPVIGLSSVGVAGTF